MTTTEPIIIPIEGQADDLINDAKRVQASMDALKKRLSDAGVSQSAYNKAVQNAAKIENERQKELQQTQQILQKTNDSNKKASMSITDFRNAYGVAMDIMRGAQAVYSATIAKTAEYANEVYKLSKVSGENAESTSRLIQVLDDYGISATQAMRATRSLTKEGFTASINDIAKLSDAYNKLGSQQEKNKFAQKNFGKDYASFIPLLEKGSAAILKQADAVNKNLILTDKQAEQYRKLTIAQDQLTDSGTGWANVISNTITPALTWFIDSLNILGVAIDDSINNNKNFFVAYRDAERAILDERDALLEIPPATDDAGDGLGDLASVEDTLKSATQRLTSEFQGLLSAMFSIQGEMDSFAEKTADIADKEKSLREEKGRLAYEMGQVNGNQEKYLDLVRKSIEIDNELKKLDEEKVKATENLAEAGKKRVYDLTQQRLAADGVVDSGEFEYLQDLAVQQGLVSRAAANLAIEESKKADAFVQSYQSTNPLMKDQLAIMQQMQAMSGTVVQFSVNYTSNMPSANPFGSKGAPKYAPVNQYTTPLYSGTTKTRDSGGPGVAGEPYAIGNIREVYVPKESGTFIPLGKARGESIGNTYNIVINNPKKETSEASLSNVLRRISYTGAAA